MVCHTTQDGQEYAGGLGFRLPFGTLHSTNITSDKETGIGDSSDQEFLNAVFVISFKPPEIRPIKLDAFRT